MKLKSLAQTTPHLAMEWHPTRNRPLRPDDVSTMSRKLVWWTCIQGHAWQATVLERQKGATCPKCSPFGSSYIEQRIWTAIRDVFPDVEHRADIKVKGGYVEVDIWIPCLQLAIEYDGPHHAKRDRQDEEKNYLLHRANIQLVRIRTMSLPVVQSFDAHVINHDTSHPGGLDRCMDELMRYISEHFTLTREQLQRLNSW